MAETIMTMKDALAWAHDEMRNTHAITEKEATEKLGVPLQDFKDWKDRVELLRVACAHYLPLAEDENSTQQAINDALKDVFAEWRGICKAGSEKEFNKNFFIRKNDANTLAEWCGRSATLTARGRVWSTKDATTFRKHVETLIGIRMTGNAVLTDSERDLITTYESAVKSIANNEKKLEDTVVKGKTEYGLNSRLRMAENDLAEEEAFLASVNADEDTKDKRLKKYRKEVSELHKEISDALRAIREAKDVCDEKKAAYDKAIALIKSVGGDK